MAFKGFYDEKWKHFQGLEHLSRKPTEVEREIFKYNKKHIYVIIIDSIINYYFYTQLRNLYIDGIKVLVTGSYAHVIFNKRNRWVIPYFKTLLMGADIHQINQKICLDKQKSKK